MPHAPTAMPMAHAHGHVPAPEPKYRTAKRGFPIKRSNQVKSSPIRAIWRLQTVTNLPNLVRGDPEAGDLEG